MGQNESDLRQKQSDVRQKQSDMRQNQSDVRLNRTIKLGQNRNTKIGQTAIGIDLGTTYSCVGVWRNGKVEIIPNEQGNRITPSCVAFHEGERLIGDGAKSLILKNPSNTIFDAKRLIGRRFQDSNVQGDISLWPFKVVANGVNGKPMIAVKHKGEEKLFAAEEISAMVLYNMKQISETFLGYEVRNAVITVPAYFNYSQRCSTKDAGRIAGLNVMRIINEPTAAALAYGLDLHESDVNHKKTVLIFDLGGGTFDVSLLEIENGTVEVKATAGDTHLGGEDFDKRMVSKLSEEFMRKHGEDISKDARAKSKLKLACERTKRQLSSTPVAGVEVECLYKGIDFYTCITRARFEDLNMDLFERCIVVLEGCLKDAKVDRSSIDDVVLVGGSTRIPKVREMLKKFFLGKALCNKLHPDEAVAHGAAIQAFGLETEQCLAPQIVLKDVTPISLGVRDSSGTMTVVIPRNSPIPIEKSAMRCTVEDNQTSILHRVYEGERSMAEDNNLLGSFLLEGIHPGPAYASNIRLVFKLDADGILNVSSKDLASGNKARDTITNDNGRLKDDEINRMIEDAERYKSEDDRRRRKAEARSELQRFAFTTRNTIREPSNASKMNKSEIYAIERKCAETIQWSEENSATADESKYEAKKKELDQLWQEIRVKLRI